MNKHFVSWEHFSEFVRTAGTFHSASSLVPFMKTCAQDQRLMDQSKSHNEPDAGGQFIDFAPVLPTSLTTSIGGVSLHDYKTSLLDGILAPNQRHALGKLKFSRCRQLRFTNYYKLSRRDTPLFDELLM